MAANLNIDVTTTRRVRIPVETLVDLLRRVTEAPMGAHVVFNRGNGEFDGVASADVIWSVTPDEQ